jgi:hypothetical protein
MNCSVNEKTERFLERRRPAGPIWNRRRIHLAYPVTLTGILAFMKLTFAGSSKYDVKMRSRGYLPHWERESAIYFVSPSVRLALSPLRNFESSTSRGSLRMQSG